MTIEMRQTCDNCGQARTLPMAHASTTRPLPDSGGWRELSHGSVRATFCNSCITIIVDHALERLRARGDGRPGNKNDRPLTLQFWEAN